MTYNAAKPLGQRGTAVIIPADNAWNLLAADRGHENDVKVAKLNDQQAGKLAKDGDLYRKAFGDDAYVVGADGSKTAFDTTVHLSKIPMPGSPELDALTRMAAKDPAKLARTVYKDGFNGTPIAANYEQAFDGYATVTGGFKIEKGRLTATAQAVLSDDLIKEYADQFKADVPWDQKPTIKVEIMADQSRRGLGLENLRAKISLTGLPPFDVDKAAEMPKLLEKLGAALEANPLDKNVILELVKGGISDIKDAWPAFAAKDLLSESTEYAAAIMPVKRDGASTVAHVRVGKDAGSIEVEDILGKSDGALNLAVRAKVAVHDGKSNLIRVDELAAGNKGLLSVYVSPKGDKVTAGQVDPATGKKSTLDNDTATGVAGMLGMLPLLLGNFLPR